MVVVLNGFEVDPRIEHLMSRADWQGKREDHAWLSRFPAHPESGRKQVPFVDLCGVEWALRENAQIREPEFAWVRGEPHIDYPPGDFDPSAGYVIGFTDMADAPICVDLRPAQGPRIIYDCLAPHVVYATAFDSIPAFVQFYRKRHGV